jgi:hypothetical protein
MEKRCCVKMIPIQTVSQIERQSKIVATFNSVGVLVVGNPRNRDLFQLVLDFY